MQETIVCVYTLICKYHTGLVILNNVNKKKMSSFYCLVIKIISSKQSTQKVICAVSYLFEMASKANCSFCNEQCASQRIMEKQPFLKVDSEKEMLKYFFSFSR